MEANQFYAEKEIATPVELCTSQGKLNHSAVGWSRRPLHTCNLKGHWPRKKQWNYWCMTNQDFLFSVTYSNIDYMGLMFAYFLDFSSKRFIEQTVMVPLAKGCRQPETVAGDIRFNHAEMNLHLDDRGDQVEIEVESPKFGGERMQAHLFIVRPRGQENLGVVIPWNDDRFQYTSKQNCMPTSGELRMGSRSLTLEPSSAMACLDFGRGMWPYRCFWNWSSFSTVVNGQPVGVNLGAGWTAGTGMTENGLLVGTQLTKLSEEVAFTYSTQDFMKPWQLKTTLTDRVNLIFTPFFERVARSNVLVVRSEVHQMIGRFTGTVTPDGGEPVEVKDVIGWAEDHHARW